jgi:hypothetical protein
MYSEIPSFHSFLGGILVVFLGDQQILGTLTKNG